MHPNPLSHKYEQFLLTSHFQKSILFKAKNMFEPNVFKLVIKQILINLNSFALPIVNI